MRVLVALVVALATVAPVAGCRRVEDVPPRGRSATPRPSTEPTSADGAPAKSAGRTVVVPDFARVAEQLGPSVVTVISTVRNREGAKRDKIVRGLGSGMIVSVTGEVLTNAHVVAGAARVDVELTARDRIPARVVAAEPLLDLALLELEPRLDNLRPVTFSGRDPVQGEWAMAIGQPFGLGHTVTVGVISGLGRDYDDLGRPDRLNPDGIWSFIQTDASINVGNSGGPLVDANGQVLGITTAVRSDGQGLAFAVPAAMAKRFLDEVRTYGRVRKARLGISAENALGEIPGRGAVVRVTKVEDGGPGSDAGIEVGDLILEMGHAPVTRVSDVAYVAQLQGPGERLTMTIKRGEEPATQLIVVPADGG